MILDIDYYFFSYECGSDWQRENHYNFVRAALVYVSHCKIMYFHSIKKIQETLAKKIQETAEPTTKAHVIKTIYFIFTFS